MKNLVITLLLFLSFQTNWAQQELNNYKYIVVPKHFDFQMGADSYQINSLTKFLLEQKGFTTIFNDEVYPDDLKTNQCLALKVNLLMESSITRTKIKLTFKDCENKIVYTSGEGSSKLKEYKKSYHEAIRGAFKSLDKFHYNYTPKKVEIITIVKNEQPKSIVKQKPKLEVNKWVIQKIKKTKKISAPLKEKKIVQVQVTKAKLPKPMVKKEISIAGLYLYNNTAYEISAFQNYFIFSMREVLGNSFRSKPLGFIYKTSKKGTYLVKTSKNFTGYVLDNGDFVIDEIGDNGSIKSVTYIKTNN